MRALKRKRARRHSPLRGMAVQLTDHEAYALAALMKAVGGIGADAIDWMAGAWLPLREERQSLPSACRRVADYLAASGFDVELP